MTKPKDVHQVLADTTGDVYRREAESVLKERRKKDVDPVLQLSVNETASLVQELQVHQIELEMQNHELRVTQHALDAERARYFDLYDLAPVGYLTLSAEGRILEANLTAATMLGVLRSELIQKPIEKFIYIDDQDIYYLYRKQFFTSSENRSCELRFVDHNQRHFWVQLIARTLQVVTGTSIVRLIVSDINDKKTYEQELNRIAQHDALTNLPNRVLLADRLNQAMIQVQRYGGLLAVVYLDLDGFKSINDTYGHDVGDVLLVTVSHLMKVTLREGDTIARLGGDEFIAILIDLTCLDDVIPLLTRLLDVVSQPIVIGDVSLCVTASMGVSFYPQAHMVDAEQLLRQADQAMYQAKLLGRNRYHIFDARQDSLLREHFEMVEVMHQAIKNDEFVLYYQPKVNMRTGVITGAEALIRWQHPERGLLQPADFLPVIEGHELSIALGEWVLNHALAQMKVWQDIGLEIAVSVNITARQLKDASFVERLAAILLAHPSVNPNHLELEVLETSKLDNIVTTAQIMTSCKALGVSFSLDDFGTGYSSLAYLQRLPICTIKIDQMFIRNMLDNKDDLTILSGILSLANAFDRNIIAEGVETIAHGQQLLTMGCECAQGYVIARPMPAEEFVSWFKTWQPDASWQSVEVVSA